MTFVIEILAIAVGVLILGVFIFIATRPTNFRVERSAQINAPGDVVFAIINDLHQWDKWSPWNKLDPNMKKTYEGPRAGPGAVSSWEGNKKAGAGRTTILESKRPESVSIRLEMFKPFPCTNQVTFKLVPSQGGTQVSWIMEGKNNFMVKAVSLVISMDKMIGKDFEEGLANLNIAAQAATQAGCV